MKGRKEGLAVELWRCRTSTTLMSMDDLPRHRRRLRQKSPSKSRLHPLEVTTRGSPSSFRHLFNRTPCGNSYSRSLSLLPPLGLDLKPVASILPTLMKQTTGENEAGAINRLVKFLSLHNKSVQRSSQKLKVIPRTLTPLDPIAHTESPWKFRGSESRSRSECKLADIGHEVSFITLDLDPRSSQVHKRRTRHLDRLPLVYIPKMTSTQAKRDSELPLPVPVRELEVTPQRKSLDSLDTSPSKPHRKAYNNRPLIYSPGKKPKKLIEITSVGPWLSEEYM